MVRALPTGLFGRALSPTEIDSKLPKDFLSEFVAEHGINSPDFAWPVSCGEKHERTDNKTLLVPSKPELLGFYRKVDEIR